MIDEPFDTYYSTEFFAKSASYTEQGQSPVTITGIFDKEYIDDTGGEIGIEGNHPVFECKESAVPNATHGETIVIDSVTYKIAMVEKDGLGSVRLHLEEQ